MSRVSFYFKLRFLILVFSFLLLYSCDNTKRTSDILWTKIIDFENLIDEQNNYGTVVTDFSRSGTHCLKKEGKEIYGPKITIGDFKEGDYFEVSVWRKRTDEKSESALLIEFKTKGEKTIAIVEKVAVKTVREWEMLSHRFLVTKEMAHKDQFTVCLWNIDQQPSYFDDLKVIKRSQEFRNFPDLEVVKLEIDSNSFAHLEKLRNQAIKKRLLITQEDSYVPAKVSYKGKKFKCKVRLKGDMSDHLKGNKWSYRVVLEKGKSIENARKFSLQSPQVRFYLLEWAYHKFLEKNNVLTTKYEFIQLNINGKSRGFYVMEEHFDTQFCISRNRRSSPIYKFFEDDCFAQGLDNSLGYIQHLVLASDITCFSKKKWVDHPLYRKGATKLFNYRHRLTDVGQNFNLQKLANFYASMCLFKAYHSNTWHNRRFILDSALDKLEIIAYDGYSEKGLTRNWVRPNIIGNVRDDIELKNFAEDYTNQVFNNKEFLEAFIRALERVSSEDFITEFQNEIAPMFNSYASMIEQEFPDFNQDLSFLHENAKGIREELPEFKSKCLVRAERKEFKFNLKVNPEDTLKRYNPEKLIKAYYFQTKKMLTLMNFCPDEISLTLQNDTSITLPRYEGSLIFKSIKLKNEINQVAFFIPTLSKSGTIEVLNQPISIN